MPRPGTERSQPVGREDPRVTRSRSCILRAAAQALAEEGAAGVTVEGVAARAGVAKTTVYRSWAGRNELLVAAFEQLAGEVGVPGSDDLRADLIAHGTRLNAALRTEAWARALPALVDQAERDHQLHELGRALAARRRAGLVDRLRRAIEAGELPASIEPELVAVQLVGPIFYRRFFGREPLPGDEIAVLVDRVLASISWSPTLSRASSSGSAAPSRSRR